MNIYELFKKRNVGRTLVFGYYGGTNYGDELLLEVLQHILKKSNVSEARLYYTHPDWFSTYHHNFGYQLVSSRIRLLGSLLWSRTIIVGGGGIWGLDANVTTFIFSLLLCLSGIVLRKKVYLISIGYYHSTNWLGHVSAWMVALGANVILARDTETYNNFKHYNAHTFLDTDMSHYISDLSLGVYKKEAEAATTRLHLNEKRVIICLRRFKSKQKNPYTELVFELVRTNPRTLFLLMILESKDIAPEVYMRIKECERVSTNCIGSDFAMNPLALYLALSENRKNLRIIAPQYHMQITAYANQISFLPIDYDAKNREFFKNTNIKNFKNILSLKSSDLSAFIR